MIEGLTYIGSHSNDDLRSIGLVFEPNFFTIYFYADPESRSLAAYRSYESIKMLSEIDLSDLKANFALSFTSDWTLMPQNVFNEADVVSYLQFNTSSETDQAEWERLIGLEAVLIYEQNKPVEEKIENIFPGLRLKHGLGALLEFCRVNRPHESNKISAFLHQAANRYSLIVFEGERLLFANTIEALHNEDVRYFVLYTLKTLELDSKTPLYLLGAAPGNNALKQKLETYLGQLNDTISISENSVPTIDSAINAEHWLGIFAKTCAL